MNIGDKIYVTKAKLEELKKELSHLKTTRRKEVAEKLEYAKSLGDLSENAEYQEAREDQVNVERRIIELEFMVKEAIIVEKHHSDSVEVGSVVVVQKAGEKTSKKFQIVGSEEADTTAGKISNTSPIGKALMGHKKGDIATFKSPHGEVKYSILDIE